MARRESVAEGGVLFSLECGDWTLAPAWWGGELGSHAG